MIRHIVFFSAKRSEDVAAIRAGLQRLGDIPHSSLFEVSENIRVDHLGNSVDVVVYAEFEDQASLDAYKAHPLYEQTTNLVRPMRDMRFSADVQAIG